MIEAMKRPIESDYTSHVAYTRALEQYCDSLESQEPVAHCTVRPLRGDESYPKTEILWVKGKPIAGPLYTHPPQRTWVGLSMEQFEYFTSYVRADVLIEIEEALMENNT